MVPQVDKELTKLRELLAQRDTEINILVNLLKKEKARVGGPTAGNKPATSPGNKPATSPSLPSTTQLPQTNRNAKTLSKVRLCVS